MMWQYKTELIKGKINDTNINNLNNILTSSGMEGWELVSLTAQFTSTNSCSYGSVDINISCCDSVEIEYNVLVFKKFFDVGVPKMENIGDK